MVLNNIFILESFKFSWYSWIMSSKYKMYDLFNYQTKIQVLYTEGASIY